MLLVLVALASPAALVLDGAEGPLVRLPEGDVVDPVTGDAATARQPHVDLATGRVVPVKGTERRSPLLRWAPEGIRAWDATTGRDLGEVLPVRPVKALLTPDGAVAVVHTEDTTEGWSTATGRRLWKIPTLGTRVGWALAGSGLAVTFDDRVELRDPRTGHVAWTVRADGLEATVKGPGVACRVGRFAPLPCPPFAPRPAPAPAPADFATDPIAVLAARKALNPRLNALRTRLAPTWPGHAEPATQMRIPTLPLHEPAPPLPAALPHYAPLTLPLDPGLPTLIGRGDGDPSVPCDRVWLDAPQGLLTELAQIHGVQSVVTVTRMHEGPGWSRAWPLGRLEYRRPLALMVSDPEESAAWSTVLGLDPHEWALVDTDQVLRWRGPGEEAGAACALAMASTAPPAATVHVRWAYTPPVETPMMTAIPGGVLAWAHANGTLVLDDDGALRWHRDGLRSVRWDGLHIWATDTTGKVISWLDPATGASITATGPLPPDDRRGTRGPPWRLDGPESSLAAFGADHAPLVWAGPDGVPAAFAPGLSWQATVDGRRGFSWHQGAIVAWEVR